MQGEEHQDYYLYPSPTLPGLGGLQSGGHPGLICTELPCSLEEHSFENTLGWAWPPPVSSPSAQVLWTC